MPDRKNEEKAVNNPKVRWGDPACWKCLTDEQRDVIYEWYTDRIREENEQAEKEYNLLESAGFFALIPFAVAYGFHSSESALGMILNALCAWLVYSVIFLLFSHGFVSWNKGKEKISPFLLVVQILVAAFATYCVLNIVYH